MDTWERIKQSLGERLTEATFHNWFAGTTLIGENNGDLLVSVPTPETKHWIETEHARLVFSTCRELGYQYNDILYIVPAASRGSGHSSVQPSRTDATGNGHDDTGAAANGLRPAASAESIFGPKSEPINPRNNFASFVVGSCNQFAHAAAIAVAEQPARRYNPLFIYGGSGLGKTHLIQAIGRALTDRYAATRVVYTTGERFMNQLIYCIRNDAMPNFHRYYRSADILLVDDVHVFAGKERTQEEFFHTFNELYDHQKQIVLTSDSPPKDTKGLVDRLRTRFEWGLLVDMQAPDLETKLAILDKKAEVEGIHLPDDVRVFLATRIRSNVRELEGALISLMAASEVTQTPITLDMARQAFRNMSVSVERKVTIESIIKRVGEHYQLTPAQMKSKTNQRQIAFPRQVAMAITKELTSSSLPEIGRAFGGKHHTTVLHSVTKIDRQRQTDPDLNRVIQSLIDSIQ
ncbi:MAG: chromosomal replication initiator protein DnaA [Bryobacteraceae bacterium]